MPRQKLITRVCNRCERELSAEAFEPVFHRGRFNGRTPRCRQCRAEVRAYHASPMAERFWPRIEKTDNGCWLWTGAVFTDGYGVFSYGKARRAHRVAWELTHGPIPEGLVVCHNCPSGDNPLCVNPDHLFLGTPGDNTRDMVAKGRACRTPGEDRWVSKLTNAQVMDIRTRYANGETQQAIADEYAITFQNVHVIVTGKGWTHLPLVSRKLPRYNEKISPEVIAGVMERFRVGSTTQRAIAKELGIGTSTVHRIVHGHD